MAALCYIVDRGLAPDKRTRSGGDWDSRKPFRSRHVAYSGYPYCYCHSRRKTSAPPSTLIFRPRPGTDARETGGEPEFVPKHAGWIIKTWRQPDSNLALKPPAPQNTSENHPYLANGIRSKVQTGRKASVTSSPGCIDVTTKAEPTADNEGSSSTAGTEPQAEPVFHERLAACHRKMPKDIPLPSRRVRLMKTRWGGLSPRGQVTLNLRLISANK